MAQVCKTNEWVSDGISIAIQVTFVFAFLTVFFFVYVTEVEKEEFRTQMNLIVDNIMKDVEDDLPNLINKQAHFNKKDAVVVINGIVDVLEEKIAIDAKSNMLDVLNKNHAVKMKAFKSLSTVIIIIVTLAVIILLIGFCIPLINQIKEAIFVVIFVGLTELTFLKVIAANYISADPNKVKRSFSQAVQNWIKVNGKLK